MKTLALSVILAAAALSVPAVALAQPNYPQEVNTHLGVSCAPQPCTLCHATAAGGGAPTTSFGRAMVQQGLNGGDVTSVDRALDALAKAGAGEAAYIDMLKACKDPNTSSSVPPLGYGCASSPSSAPASPLGVIAGLCVALGLAISRRRRR